MKTIIKPISLILISALMLACNKSQDVISSGIIQKRKHLPGVYLNIKKQEHNKLIAEKKQKATSETVDKEESVALKPYSQRFIASAEPITTNFQASENINKNSPDNYRGPTPKESRIPLKKVPSIQYEATKRTEELADIKEAKQTNQRNLKASGIISLFSVSAFIFGSVSFLVGGPLVFVGYGLASLGAAIGRFSLPMFVIYLIERIHLKDGILYFDETRIEKFSETAASMHRIQRIASILLVFSVIGLIALLLTFPVFAFLPYLFVVTFSSASTLTSLIGIITSFMTRKKHPESKRLLVKLIIWRFLTNMLLAAALGVVLIMFYNFLLSSF